jgi:hypothetical protein
MAGGWETVGTYPLDQWLDVEVVLTPAKDAPGTWALRLTGPGGPELVQRDGLPCRNLAFRTCTWFGIVGADTHATGFYVDDILLE